MRSRDEFPTVPHGLCTPRTPDQTAGKAGTCHGVGAGRGPRRNPRAGAGTHHTSVELLAHSRAASPAPAPAPRGLPRPGTVRVWGSWMHLGHGPGPDPGPGPGPDPGPGSGPALGPVYRSEHLFSPSPQLSVPSPARPERLSLAPCGTGRPPVTPVPAPRPGPRTVCGRALRPLGPHREQHEPLPLPGCRRAEAPDQPPPRRPPIPCPRLRGGESAAGAGDPRLGRVRSHLYLPGAIRGGAGACGGHSGASAAPRRGSIAFCRRSEENRHRHRTRQRHRHCEPRPGEERALWVAPAWAPRDRGQSPGAAGTPGAAPASRARARPRIHLAVNN